MSLGKEGDRMPYVPNIPFRPMLVVLVLVCAAAVRADEPKVKDPSLKVVGIRLEALHLTTADLLVAVEVTNPNPSVTLTNLAYRVKLNGVPSGEGKYGEKLTLPDKGKMALDLPVTVDLTSLPGVGVEGVLAGVKLEYHVTAEFDVSLFIFKKHVTRALAGKVPVSALLPRVTLPRLRLPDILRGST